MKSCCCLIIDMADECVRGYPPSIAYLTLSLPYRVGRRHLIRYLVQSFFEMIFTVYKGLEIS